MILFRPYFGVNGYLPMTFSVKKAELYGVELSLVFTFVVVFTLKCSPQYVRFFMWGERIENHFATAYPAEDDCSV